MIGKIFITRTGYDPACGKHIKDPFLSDQPSLGGCRPDVRKMLAIGDHIFVISGKVRNVQQFVMGGFEVARKLTAVEAYNEFPEQRLHLLGDGQLSGNVIVNADGAQHELDGHKPGTFQKRVANYVVGCKPIVLSTPEEIERGRRGTMEALQEIFKKKGASPKEIISRFGRKITEEEVQQLRTWLQSLKAG